MLIYCLATAQPKFIETTKTFLISDSRYDIKCAGIVLQPQWFSLWETRWICKGWRCYWKQIWSVEDCGLWWRAHSLQLNTDYEWFPQNNRNTCMLSTLIHTADGTLILMLKTQHDAQEQFNAILLVLCACAWAGRGHRRGVQFRFLLQGRRHAANGCRLSPSSSCDTIFVS